MSIYLITKHIDEIVDYMGIFKSFLDFFSYFYTGQKSNFLRNFKF